jgi:LemA protein
MGHEQGVLEGVTQARTAAMTAAPGSAAARTGAENQLSGALKTLFAVAENYPQLRATENFQQLQQQLSAIESDLQSARRYYNAAVRDLNTAIQVFPSNVIAGLFHFSAAAFFQAEDQERATPAVSFSS